MPSPTNPSRPRPSSVLLLLALLLVFLLGLIPRLYSAVTVGWNWDYPGSFTLVNFDEGGSCRAALQGFDYPTFIGHQTIFLNSLAGRPPPPGIEGDAAAVKAYCHSPGHLTIARVYSAVTGALTPVLLAVIGLSLLPSQAAVGLTAGTLLAVSGFHMSQSHSGTVDAPSVFYIYLFLTALVLALHHRWRAALWLSPLLLAAAVWTKYWVFAVCAYAAAIPQAWWQRLLRGWSTRRLTVAVVAATILFGCVSNSDFPLALYPLLALFYGLVPWRKLARPMIPFWLLLPLMIWGLSLWGPVAAFTSGGLEGRFGSGYAAIGWHKWLRNLLNVPLVLMVGLGLPACLFIPAGLRVMWRLVLTQRAWWCLLPVLAFALYMLVLAPVTYYRHYLVLLPAAALFAALGYWSVLSRAGRWLLLPFLVWPALLALDLERDYHRDPRVAVRQWYASEQPRQLFSTYYVNPPRARGRQHALFRPEYAGGPNAPLRRAQFLVVSENWYDTAFANELNGPLVNDLSRLVKTTPERALFYRQLLANELHFLTLERVFEVSNFMPELVLHKKWYGTFQLFVGDIRIYRVTRDDLLH